MSTDVQSRQITNAVAFFALVLAIAAIGKNDFAGTIIPGVLLLIVSAQTYRFFVSRRSQSVARNIGLVVSGVALLIGYLQWAQTPGSALMLAVFPVLTRSVSNDCIFLKANIAYLVVIAFLLLVSPVDEVAWMGAGDKAVLMVLLVFFVVFNISQRVLERRRYMSLAKDCVYDPLTKLLNRRGIDLFISHHLEAVRRENGTFAVLMVDIDHFKRFNDRYGHASGDVVLKRVGKCLQRMLRGVDQAGRLGGEEFLIVLPGVTQVQAMWVAERVRQSIADLDISQHGIEDGVTVSIGVAISTKEVSIGSLINRADMSMYKAKQNGRNCCEIE